MFWILETNFFYYPSSSQGLEFLHASKQRTQDRVRCKFSKTLSDSLVPEHILKMIIFAAFTMNIGTSVLLSRPLNKQKRPVKTEERISFRSRFILYLGADLFYI